MPLLLSTKPRPHYLLELGWVALRAEDGSLLQTYPEWVGDNLSQAPFVVVRRAPASEDLVPIGVRGQLREQRFAAFVLSETVWNVITPEDLRQKFNLICEQAAIDETHGIMQSLCNLRERWSTTNLPWGPGGSAGFQLASDIVTVKSTSDLDIVVYADDAEYIPELHRLFKLLPAGNTAIDVQVETPFCGFSLAEFSNAAGPILLKTPAGPLLGTDPWSVNDCMAETNLWP
jgi:phosphoribosyl-dephospho-CoA transferase